MPDEDQQRVSPGFAALNRTLRQVAGDIVRETLVDDDA